MTVRPFPPAEPWPAETFADYGIRDLEQLEHDVHAEIVRRRVAAVDTGVCPDCGDTTHLSETVCEGCAAHLVPCQSPVDLPARMMADALDATYAALAAPPRTVRLAEQDEPVVDLFSRKVLP